MSIDPQLNSIAQWQYTAQWKVHYCFHHVAQGNNVIFFKKGKGVRGGGATLQTRFVELTQTLKWPQIGGVVRGSQWEIIVHVFSLLAIFILSLTTLATEQKPKTCFFWLKDRGGKRVERKRERANLQWSWCISLWARHSLFYCRTKW